MVDEAVPRRRQRGASRRAFLRGVGSVTAAALGAGAVGGPPGHRATHAQAAAASRVVPPSASPPAAPARLAAPTDWVARLRPGGPDPLARLTLDSFTPHVGTTFQVATQDGPVAVELVAARGSPYYPDKPELCFSLLFRAAPDAPLGALTYEFSHPRLGTFPLFITPVLGKPDGRYYEAVFNRLVP